MTTETSARSAVVNYRIHQDAAGWRLDRGPARLGAFDDPADAVAEACRTAKADAERGRVAIITAETVPQELHCYVPLKVGPAGEADFSSYLRLVASR
jgi:hypothetical protein